jgi:hypothetical protein
MAMVPKTFKLPDYQARALHQAALDRNVSDGELIRKILHDYLEEQGYDIFDFVPPLSGRPNNR